jgi:hypothetical protein
MNTLINIIIAAVIFGIVYFYLVPLLPDPLKVLVGILVVVAAIIYLLTLVTGYSWPWIKK